MTLIEFFDFKAIDNVIGALLLKPERVVFIGNDRSAMESRLPYYNALLGERGIMTEMIVRSVNRNSLTATLNALEEILDTYGDCVFDIEGGDEMYLMAVGIIMARREGIQVHRIHVQTNKIQNCDMDNHVCKAVDFDVSVKEYLMAGGGEIVYDRREYMLTFDWHFNPELEEDIRKLWTICARNNFSWNRHINTLAQMAIAFNLGQSSEWSFDPELGKKYMTSNGGLYCLELPLMRELERYGFITDLIFEETRISFKFKNHLIRRILTNAGQILELYVAMLLRKVPKTNRDPKPYCHDVRVGVHIDWNRTDDDSLIQTVNEIDVIAMRDAVPIFISCKNGAFTVDELYKFRTVADRFGYGYAVMILVMTDPERLGYSGDYIMTRAADMGIRVISCVHDMDEAEFTKELSMKIR